MTRCEYCSQRALPDDQCCQFCGAPLPMPRFDRVKYINDMAVHACNLKTAEVIQEAMQDLTAKQHLINWRI